MLATGHFSAPADSRGMTSTLPKAATKRPRAAATEQDLQTRLDSRDAQLAVVNEISAALGKQLSFQEIVDAVGDRLSEIFGTGDMYIAILDEERGMIDFRYWTEHGERDYEVPPIALGQGLTSQILQTGKPLRVGSFDDASHLGAITYGELQESFLGVPIPASNKTIGVLSLSKVEAGAFTEEDERLVATVASSMGVALESARLFDQTKSLLARTEEQNAELAVVNEVGQALAKQLDLAAVTELVGERLHSLFPGTDMFVALYDAGSKMISFPYEWANGARYHTEPMPATKGLTAKVIKTKAPVLIRSAAEAKRQRAIILKDT